MPPDPFVMGHEFVGEVVALGPNYGLKETGNKRLESYTTLKVGDKVVSPFTTSCGECQCVFSSTSFINVSHASPVLYSDIQLLSNWLYITLCPLPSLWLQPSSWRTGSLCSCTIRWRNTIQNTSRSHYRRDRSRSMATSSRRVTNLTG